MWRRSGMQPSKIHPLWTRSCLSGWTITSTVGRHPLKSCKANGTEYVFLWDESTWQFHFYWPPIWTSSFHAFPLCRASVIKRCLSDNVKLQPSTLHNMPLNDGLHSPFKYGWALRILWEKKRPLPTNHSVTGLVRMPSEKHQEEKKEKIHDMSMERSKGLSDRIILH